MNDFTAGAGEAYAACKTLFEDLNRLAIDFGHAVRNTGVDLPKSEEYSYSPNELLVKRDHVWVSYRLDESGLTFTAAYVILEKGTHHIKVGPPGRPEIWFLLGRATRVTKPKNNIAIAVRSMFVEVERPNFRPALAVGGDTAHYCYDAAGEIWSVVLLGLELGEIDSPEVLERRVVGPLRAAAADHAIQL